MVDKTLILHLPKEVRFDVVKIFRVWSEANVSLVIMEFDFRGIRISELNVINSQELIQSYSNSAPFSE